MFLANFISRQLLTSVDWQPILQAYRDFVAIRFAQGIGNAHRIQNALANSWHRNNSHQTIGQENFVSLDEFGDREMPLFHTNLLKHESPHHPAPAARLMRRRK